VYVSVFTLLFLLHVRVSSILLTLQAEASLGETETTFFVLRDSSDAERDTGAVFVLLAADAASVVQRRLISADQVRVCVWGGRCVCLLTCLLLLVSSRANASLMWLTPFPGGPLHHRVGQALPHALGADLHAFQRALRHTVSCAHSHGAGPARTRALVRPAAVAWH
jgi:hypothetical protein